MRRREVHAVPNLDSSGSVNEVDGKARSQKQVVKRSLLLNTCLLFAFALSGHAQSVDELKKCVGFIFGQVHLKGPDGKLVRDERGQLVLLDQPLGTGFFVFYPDKRGGPDYGFVYFVTAKHVLRDADDSYLRQIKIRLNLQKSENQSSFGLGEVAVADDKDALLWFEDADDPQNDVVILPLLPDQTRVDFKAIPIDMFVNSELIKQQHVGEGDSVYLLGLMPQYYGEKRNYPVVRRGSLALLTEESIKTGPNTRQHVYLAELGSWPGNSGSPVFLNLAGFRNGSIMAGSDFRLLGLMLGYLSNLRQADIVDTRAIIGGDPSNIGISFILPSETIRTVLDAKPVQLRRDSEINKLLGKQSAH